MKILLADDDGDDRFLFENAMKEVDDSCALQTAQDGEEFITMIQKGTARPDIILLDMNMPKKNGLACLADVRARPEFDDTPVIILSTGTNDHEVMLAYNNRANLFIRKPNSYTALKEIVKHCIVADFRYPPDISKKDFLILDSKQLLSIS